MSDYLWLLYFSSPAIGLLYAIIEYTGGFDKLTGRKDALEGLERLRSANGFPTSWIYDKPEDKGHFNAIYKRIKKNIRDPQLSSIFTSGSKPSLIVTAGQAIRIDGVKPEWEQGMRSFYSEQHPVLVIFGDVNEDGGITKGKAERACSLKDIDDWLRDEKENRKFCLGAVVLGLLSISVLALRLSLS